MGRRKGFTLIELLVVISIIVLLVAILTPALTRAKRQAMNLICQSNLRQYGIGARAYLDDNDSYFYSPYRWLYREGGEPFGQDKWPDGWFWPYISAKDIHLCPIFGRLAKQREAENARYSYSANGFLGKTGSGRPGPYGTGRVWKNSEIIRFASSVFLFSEENWWLIPGLSSYVLNDTNLLVRLAPYSSSIYTDCFATYHSPPHGDLDKGSANVVFLDGHVDSVSEEEQRVENTNFGTFSLSWPVEITQQMRP